MIKLNLDKLEKILISNWTEILRHEELSAFVSEQIKQQKSIHRLTITRFHPTPEGFILWIEFTTKNKTSGTIEALLTVNGGILQLGMDFPLNDT